MARENGRTSRSTGRTAQGEQSRAVILEEARRLFADSGFRGTSMASVAAAADLTQPGLLHHFPSKEALLHAVLEQHYHDDGRRLNKSMANGDAGIMNALERLVEHNTQSERATRFFSVLVAESISPDHPGHEYFKRRYRKVRARLAASLRDDQAAARVRADTDPDELAAVIAAAMDGLQIQWLLDPGMDMMGAFRALADLIAGERAHDASDPGHAAQSDSGLRDATG